ncbi:MAG: FAD-dependent thymidylate synthase [Ignisphaera sp.]|nr:FAD-dependent thymidylate synthase [Ignisphaera sp.]
MTYLEEIKARELTYISRVASKENIYGDNIAEVIHFDFGRANLSDDSRIEAVTLIAAACYANPNAIGRSSLFSRLEQESLGLPSSSFEFIPVFLDRKRMFTLLNLFERLPESKLIVPNVVVFGEMLEDKSIITNYRALFYDYQLLTECGVECEDITKWYNTEEECKLLSDKFKVFLSHIDTNTRTQYIRHRRAAWQELSRRYVSGKKVGISYYVSDTMQGIYSKFDKEGESGTIHIDMTTELLIELCTNHYNAAIANNVAPQDARRILPQAMYTLVWSGFLPSSLENFFKLRDDSHAQWEIRQLALAKKELINYKEDKHEF